MTSNSANLFTFGTWKAWLLAALAITIAGLLDASLVWSIGIARLLISYCIAIVLVRVVVGEYELGGELIVAVGAALVAAVITEFTLTLLTYAALSGFSGYFANGIDLLLSTIFSSYLLMSTILSDAAHRQIKSEKQMVELKLNALQAQIEPHFFYNTLANMQELVRTSPSNAELMIQHLIVYLKAAIPDVRKGNTLLGQEVDRAKAYLQIMQIRMGERLQFEIQVADDLRQIAVPPLGLMTLVENAVQHGIDKLPEGGKVTIIAAMCDKELTLQVIDNGTGFDDNIGSGMGLTNLRERLATAYGTRASFDLTSNSPRGVEAKLWLPIAA